MLYAMAQFSKDELTFVKNLPEHVEIECPICLNILIDPHLVTCCGHNFCGSCIERVRASNGACPMCKEREYQYFTDKRCLRIVNGLEVYCANHKKGKGCEWKGELKNLPAHLNEGIREGECQYEEVKCRYDACQKRKSRRYLENHEQSECFHRPYQCRYCKATNTYLYITKQHYEDCSAYPVLCPNKCRPNFTMPRYHIITHLTSECQLEPVDCVFSWAGCKERPLREDLEQHNTDIKHIPLLATACEQLMKENERIKQESQKIKEQNEKIKEENADIKEENKNMKEKYDHLQEENIRTMFSILNAMNDDTYPILPPVSTLDSKSGVYHFYTEMGGHLISVRVLKINYADDDLFGAGAAAASALWRVFIAVHKGKFDQFNKQNLPQFSAMHEDDRVQILASQYHQLSIDALAVYTDNEMLPSPDVMSCDIKGTNHIEILLPSGNVKKIHIHDSKPIHVYQGNGGLFDDDDDDDWWN